MPSTVRISAPSGTRLILVMQASVYLPFTRTAHEPQWPSSQPSLVPVSISPLRITSINVVSGSKMSVWGTPLTIKVDLFMLTSWSFRINRTGSGIWLPVYTTTAIEAFVGGTRSRRDRVGEEKASHLVHGALASIRL